MTRTWSDFRALVAAIGLMSAAALSAVTMPAAAHHSFAPYETELQISFRGTVTDFTWNNPHVYIEMDAPDADGNLRHWLIECANPGILNRVGWKWNMIEVGDDITVIVAPLRSGEPGALLKGVRLADGRTFGNGGPAGPATIDFHD